MNIHICMYACICIYAIYERIPTLCTQNTIAYTRKRRKIFIRRDKDKRRQPDDTQKDRPSHSVGNSTSKKRVGRVRGRA